MKLSQASTAIQESSLQAFLSYLPVIRSRIVFRDYKDTPWLLKLPKISPFALRRGLKVSSSLPRRKYCDSPS